MRTPWARSRVPTTTNTVNKTSHDAPPIDRGRPTRAGAVATVAGLLTLLAWAVSSPILASPDEDFHLASIWCADTTSTVVSTDECGFTGEVDEDDMMLRLVPGPLVSTVCNPASDVSDECPREEVPDLEAIRSNSGSYPSGYYRVAHTVTSSSPAGSALAVRILNLTLAVILFASAAAIAESRLRKAFSLALAIGLFPFGLFFIPSVNPTGWSITALVSMWMFLTTLGTTSSPRRQALAAAGCAVSFTLAVSSRSDSCVYAAVLTTGAVLGCFDRAALRSWRMAVPGAMVGLAAYQYLTGFASRVAAEGMRNVCAPDETCLEGWSLLSHNLVNLWTLLGSIFGGGTVGYGLGNFQVRTPEIGALLAVIALLVVIAALSVADLRQRLALLMLWGAVAAIPLLLLQQSGLRVERGMVTARYLLPLALATLGLSLHTLLGSRRWRRPPRAAIWLTWAVIAGLNSAALLLQVLNTRGPVYIPFANVDPAHEWWWPGVPLGPYAFWAIGSVSGGIAAAALFAVGFRLERPQTGAPLESAATESKSPSAHPPIDRRGRQ